MVLGNHKGVATHGLRTAAQGDESKSLEGKAAAVLRGAGRSWGGVVCRAPVRPSQEWRDLQSASLVKPESMPV